MRRVEKLSYVHVIFVYKESTRNYGHLANKHDTIMRVKLLGYNNIFVAELGTLKE